MHSRISTLLKVWVILMALPLGSIAQTDSSRLRISLLTCSPGAELYSTFGHSALRIVDSSAGTDVVYNFGVFDFYDPDFYLKFVKGKLLYYLDQQAFPDFIYGYEMEGRQISEQVLSLPATSKKKLQGYLFHKVRPENRSYKYDFLYDNCTTRLRDLIMKSIPNEGKLVCVPRPGEQTFRKHLHTYLDGNGKDWAKLGIDILLGRRLDRIMTDDEAMFLPDYLEKGIDGTTMNGRPLVAEKIQILPRRLAAIPTSNPPMSLLVLGFFALMMILASKKQHPALVRLTQMGDVFLFLITGILGILLVFMWTGTDHQICKENMNLLWALPTHLPAAFLTTSDKRWVKGYFKGVAWLSMIILLGWPALTQAINLSLLPLIAWMGFSAFRLSKSSN
jgi:Domain of unknown function (DUF4105)